MTVAERVAVALARHRTGGPDAFSLSDEELREIEGTIGFVFPEALRCLYKRHMPVMLLWQVVTGLNRTTHLDPVEFFHPGPLPDLTLEDMYAEPDERTPSWLAWLRLMVPFAPAGGQSFICLDYAFDPVDPPVIHLDGERSYVRPGRLYRGVDYLACDFLSFLELEVTTEDLQDYDRTATASDERLLAWHRHRDAILGPLQHPLGKPPP